VTTGRKRKTIGQGLKAQGGGAHKLGISARIYKDSRIETSRLSVYADPLASRQAR